MGLEGYLNSNFAKSQYCRNVAAKFTDVAPTPLLVNLRKHSIAGNIASRFVTPFFVAGMLVVLLSLRIASIVEPIIGMLADIGAALAFRSAAPLLTCVKRLPATLQNLPYVVTDLLSDIAVLGTLLIGGMFYSDSTDEEPMTVTPAAQKN